MNHAGGTEAERTLRHLQRVTDAALAHLSLDDLLDELLERVREILEVDTAAVLMLAEDGAVLEARAAKGLEEEVERGVRIPVGKGFAGRIAADRRAVIIDDVDHADILNPLLREKGLRTLLGVPLLVDGRVIGVLHVGSLSGRKFTEVDADLLQRAADRAALAIDHVRLFEAECRARAAAETSVERLTRLQRITDTALAHLSLDDLLDELLERVREVLEVDTAVVLMLVEEEEVVEARAAKGLEEEVERGVRIPVGKGFAGRVAAERKAVIIDDVDHADILNPLLREKGLRSLLGVPLIAEGDVIGVLHVGSLGGRQFDDHDADFLQLAADRAALAIRAAQLFEHEQAVAESLQQSLLPRALPEMPGVGVAARYVPATIRGQLGGDWYDAFALEDGRLAVAIGDVVGHGLEAASLMGQLRNGVRAYALEGSAPAEIATRLSRLLHDLERGRSATLIYAVFDPDSDTVTLTSAGHPPPLVVSPDGTSELLELPASVPLGVMRRTSYEETSAELPPGSTLLLFTDGVVERRDEGLEDGLVRLRETVAAAPGDAEEMCDRVCDRLLPSGMPDDDAALIALRSVPLEERLRLSLPAEPEVAPMLRRVLGRWLGQVGAARAEAEEIKLACSEACANAIEHAYAPGHATFEVEAVREDGEVVVTVRDRGQWREARGEFRGRGLLLMEGLMHAVDVRQSPEGSSVTLRRTLGKEPAA